MNVILRPACNRPEMLHISIETEIAARKYCEPLSDLLTIFVIDAGDNAKVIELAKAYPYKKEIIIRDTQYGLTKNILEGMKTAFSKSDDYIFYIEDDIIVHKTYFQYMDTALELCDKKKFTIVSSFSFTNSGDINKVARGNRYSALGPIIMKPFFDKYILQHVNDAYYKDDGSRISYIKNLDKQNEKYFVKGYKYRDFSSCHNEQAGLINRLIDVAKIEGDGEILLPYISRAVHIGFYGKNRPGKVNGNNFEERLRNIKNIISSKDTSRIPNSAKYGDYQRLSGKLNEWDGTLKFWIKPK